MAAITTRSTSGTGATVKNSTLTNTEVDNNFINLNVDIQTRLLKTGGTTLYIGSQANSTRFPNSVAVFSDVASGIQKNEAHNIGLVSEKTGTFLAKTIITGSSGGTTITLSDVTGIYIGQVVSATGVASEAIITNINTGTNVVTLSIANVGTPSGTANIIAYGVGAYGVGYTSGGCTGIGIVGEAHVNISSASGKAIGVKGYSNDTHASGSNIGLYGSAENGLTNYSLYLNKGNIYSESTVNKIWYLNSNLTFSNVGGSYSVTIPQLVLGTELGIGQGGTGATNSPDARINLGLVIGTHVQAYNAKLSTLAALTFTDSSFIVGTGTTWQIESGATARTSLGLGSIATQNSNAISITGGSLSGITSIGVSTITATSISLVTALTIGDGGTGRTTIGSNGQVLTSNGTSLNYVTPSYVPAQSVTGKYLKTNGTTASWDSLDISSTDMIGTLPVTKGGTGLTTILDNGLIVGNGANSIGTIAPGVAKRILRSNGTDWYSAPATGMVVQTISNKVDTKATFAFATYNNIGTIISNLNTAITTSYASSKILVQFNISFEVHHDTVFRLFRQIAGGADVEIGRNTTDTNYWSGIWLPGYDADNDSTARTNHYMFMDSPNCASGLALIYKLMIQSGGVGAGTFYLNRPISSVGQRNYEVATSTVLLQEIY
jgi:hypothetical protein